MAMGRPRKKHNWGMASTWAATGCRNECLTGMGACLPGVDAAGDETWTETSDGHIIVCFAFGHSETATKKSSLASCM